MPDVRFYTEWDGKQDLLAADTDGDGTLTTAFKMPPAVHKITAAEYEDGYLSSLTPEKVVEVLPQPWQTSDTPANSDILNHSKWRNAGITDYLGRGKAPNVILDMSSVDSLPQNIVDNWTRSTQATYWDGSQLQTAAAHEPRIQVDPQTGERYLLAEPQRTNTMSPFDDANSKTTISDRTDLDGPGDQVPVRELVGKSNNGEVYPSGTENLRSIYLKERPENPSGSDVGLSIGSNDTPVGDSFICFSPKRGGIVEGETYGGSNIINYGMIPLTNGWYFCWVLFEDVSGEFARMGHPGIRSNVPSDEGILSWGPQDEKGTAPSSWIPHNNTRAADDLSNLPLSMQSGAKSVYFRIGQEAGGYGTNEGGNVTNAEVNLVDSANEGSPGAGLLRPSTGIAGISESGVIKGVINSSDEDLQGNSTTDTVDRLNIQPNKDTTAAGAILKIFEMAAWEEERTYDERRNLTDERPQPWQELDAPNINTLDTLGGDIDWSNLGISEPPHLNIDIPRFGIPAKMAAAWKRDTVATYWDKNGVLQTAQAGEPRIHRDPATGDVIGVLGESNATNNIDSRQLNGGSWGAVGDSADLNFSSTSGIDGTSNAQTIEDTDGSNDNGARYIHTFSNDVPNGWSFSIFVEKDSNTSRFPRIDIDLRNGSPTPTQAVKLNTSDGTATADGIDDGAYSVEDYGQWWKVTVSVNNGDPDKNDDQYGNTEAIVRVYPAKSDSLSGGSSTTGAVTVDAPQLERHQPVRDDSNGNLQAAYSSTPILGGGTRDYDDLILPLWFITDPVGGYWEIYREVPDPGSIPRGSTTTNEHKFAMVNAFEYRTHFAGLTKMGIGFGSAAGYVTNSNPGICKGADNTDSGRDDGKVEQIWLRPTLKANHPFQGTYSLRRMFLWDQKFDESGGAPLDSLYNHDFTV